MTLTVFPLSLLSIIRDKIVRHLQSHSLIGDSQHSFRNNRSYLPSLLIFYNDLLVYDSIRSLDIVYLDFQKAFDKDPHHRLLYKLKKIGIDVGDGG